MITISIAASKGGVGKTTLCAALAVRAAKGGKRVAMMDLNYDQGNLAMWWVGRGKPDNPLLLDMQPVKGLAREGFEYLFVDTPPIELDRIEEAIKIADFVLVPLRTSAFDVVAVEAVSDLCRTHGKPFGFLLSAVDAKATALNAQVVYALSEIGPLLKSRISYRIPYIYALAAGKTGAEIDKRLANEIDVLWAEITSKVECVHV